jgi:hypothetical protein
LQELHHDVRDRRVLPSPNPGGVIQRTDCFIEIERFKLEYQRRADSSDEEAVVVNVKASGVV